MFGSFHHLLYRFVGHGGHALTSGVCVHLSSKDVLEGVPAYNGVDLGEGVGVVWSGAR